MHSWHPTWNMRSIIAALCVAAAVAVPTFPLDWQVSARVGREGRALRARRALFPPTVFDRSAAGFPLPAALAAAQPAASPFALPWAPFVPWASSAWSVGAGPSGCHAGRGGRFGGTACA